LFLAAFCLAGSRGWSQALFYATSSATQAGNTVAHVSPGTGANGTILTATGAGGNLVLRCTAIAMDSSVPLVFLLDAEGQQILSMHLDGSSLATVAAITPGTPTDIALDTVHQQIYFTTSGATQASNTIQRVSYTGTGGTVLFTATGSSGNGVSRCTALALDLLHSQIMFSDAGSNALWTNALWSIPLAGGSSATSVKNNLPGAPLDLALDVTNQLIYYITSSTIQSSNTVQRVAYAGGTSTLLFTATGGASVQRCTAIEFDPVASKLYLADAGASTLWSLNADGSGLATVKSGVFSIPRRVRLLPSLLPVVTWANPAPIIYGVALTAAQLNATANVPGGFAYNPAIGAVLKAGTNTLSVIFTPTDSVDYSNVTNTVNLVVSPAPVTISSGITANNKVYSGTTPTTLSSNTVVLSGVVNGDTLSLNTNGYAANFANAGVGNGIAVSVTGLTLSGASATNYILTQPATLTANITKAPVTITSGITANNKVYNGTTTATLSSNTVVLSGVVNGDTLTLSTNGYAANFASAGVGNGIAVSVTGLTLAGASNADYTFTQPASLTANITAAPVTITSGITANNKVYNGTTTATLSSNTVVLSGIVNGDTLSLNTNGYAANFASAGVGNGIAVSVTGLTLSGASNADYTFTQPASLTANITAASVTISSGITANNKVYDGTTAAILSSNTVVLSGVVNGDTLTLSTNGYIANFASAGVGNGIVVSVTGLTLSGASNADYTLAQPASLTANITKAPVTITSGITANNKVYNGTTTATLISNTVVLSGVVNGDTLSLNTNGYTANFASAGVGNGIVVSVTGLTLSGASNADYTFMQPASLTANITAAPATITSGITANNKVYNGTTTATLSSNTVVLAGVVNGDTLSLNTNGYLANFASAGVGNGIAVTVIGLTLSGASNADYTFTQPASLTANITAAPVTITSGITANNKVYDGTTTAILSSNTVVLSGVVNGDILTLSTNGYAANFASAGVGNGIAVTVTGLTLSGTSNADYTLVQPASLTANITAAPVIFTSGSSTTFLVGSSGTFTITATSFPVPALGGSGTLPNGITFVAATGILSGTPAAGTGGTYPLTFTATNAFGTNTQSFTLTVDQPPAITSATNTIFNTGNGSNFTVTATGFPAPALSESGTLPVGVAFTNASGILGGIPAAGSGGTYPISFTATNSTGTNTQSFTLTVNQAPVITNASSVTFLAGSAGTFMVGATGFPVAALSESGALPGGVTFVPATGILSGTPAAGSGGSYPLVFTATNSTGTNTQSFTLTVSQGVAITSANSTTFTTGAAGNFAVITAGFPAPVLSQSGSLPGGVTFTPGTGILSGTPAAGTGGTYPFTFTATNAVGTNTQSFTLTVDQPPAITSANNTVFNTGNASNFTVTATGFPGPSLSESGTLPAGVAFTNSSGILGGTPVAGTRGSYPITFTATNSTGTNTQSFTLAVNQAPAINCLSEIVTNAPGVASLPSISFAASADGFPAPVISYSLNSAIITSPYKFPIGINFVTITATNAAGTNTCGFNVIVELGAALPVLAAVPDQTVNVGSTLLVTNTATEAIVPPRQFTFSLGADAPAGSCISSNGVFQWSPLCEQGSTTNLITVWATDNGTPALSNLVSFNVAVSACVQVTVGSSAVLLGNDTSVPVNLFSTVSLTNLNFSLVTLAGRFGNWAAASTNPAIATASTQAADPSQPQFNFAVQSGQTLLGASSLGTISVEALPTGKSAFAQISITNILATASNNTLVAPDFGGVGRIVLIDTQPLLETTLTNGTSPVLTIYGNPGSNYNIMSATNLLAPITWTPFSSLTLTNLFQFINLSPSTNPMEFFRAVQP
jgi:hypothetical protein